MSELTMDLSRNALTLETRDGKLIAVSRAGKNVIVHVGDDEVMKLRPEEADALGKALRNQGS